MTAYKKEHGVTGYTEMLAEEARATDLAEAEAEAAYEAALYEKETAEAGFENVVVHDDKNTGDPFGFADAVQVDHLTDEQVDLVAAIFDKEEK